jgi:hypothetical protein
VADAGLLAQTAVRKLLHRVVPLNGNRSKVVVVLTEDEPLGQETLDLATTYLPRLEDFLGEFSAPAVTIIVDASIDAPCSTRMHPPFLPLQFNEPLPLIYLTPDCIRSPVFLANELAHVFGGSYPDWYSEAIGGLAGAIVAGELPKVRQDIEDALATIETSSKIHLEGPNERPAHFAGLLFLAKPWTS